MSVVDPGLARQGSPELEAARVRSYLGGFVIFLISESMFFVPLFASRFVLAGTGHPPVLDQALALAVTLVIGSSVLPATRMRNAASSGSWTEVQRWALVTAGAGVLLLAGLAWEWAGLRLDPQSRYGGIYFLAMGMHAFHIVAAVLFLVGVAARARSRRFSTTSHFPVVAAGLFWYFVVGLWGAVWVVFYLI